MCPNNWMAFYAGCKSGCILLNVIGRRLRASNRRCYSTPLRVSKSVAQGKRTFLKHPLLENKNKALRQRVVNFIKSGCSVRERSNIIFVCGGNEGSTRSEFFDYCLNNYKEIELFKPEDAMQDLKANIPHKQFNIAEFEELIGDISHAIVIFPEGAGSHAETGYFCNIKNLAQKTILALDIKYYSEEPSFISLGPALIYNKDSHFGGTIHIEYSSTDKNDKFKPVLNAIRKTNPNSYFRKLEISAFSSLSSYNKMCLIYGLFDLMRIATLEDIFFLHSSIFKSQFERDIVQK